MQLLSIQLGTPRPYEAPDEGGTYLSAIEKRPVTGRVELGVEGLAGDAVADRRAHGGPDQALLAYATGHYEAWATEGLPGLGPGAFGEKAGAAIAQEARLHPAWTVRRAARAMAARHERRGEAAERAQLAPLAADWRYRLARGA